MLPRSVYTDPATSFGYKWIRIRIHNTARRNWNIIEDSQRKRFRWRTLRHRFHSSEWLLCYCINNKRTLAFVRYLHIWQILLCIAHAQSYFNGEMEAAQLVRAGGVQTAQQLPRCLGSEQNTVCDGNSQHSSYCWNKISTHTSINQSNLQNTRKGLNTLCRFAYGISNV